MSPKLSEEQEDANIDLSDTDGKNPEEEFSAWRIRELTRIKRDREVKVAREMEKQEVLRRREMPEEERLKEDLKRVKEINDEKEKNRSDIGFLQKYYHKGAFFQDMDILKRDYNEKTESSVDKTKLPAMMQVRDYGKKGRSKWT